MRRSVIAPWPPLLAGIHLLLRWHVLFPSDAEIALYGTPAHGTPVELAEAGGADAGVPARQQRPRQGEVLANDAELFTSCVPQRTRLRVACSGSYDGTSVVAVVVARLREGKCGAQTGGHVGLVVVGGVAGGQVELLEEDE